MGEFLDESIVRRDVLTIPTIWVAFALSLLIHAAALWKYLPELRILSGENPEKSQATHRMQVYLPPRSAPPPSPPPSMAQLALPSPIPQVRPPNTTIATIAQPRPTPPVIALNQPAPDRATPRQAAPSVATPPAAPPAAGDMAALIEARRRARSETAAPASPGGEPGEPTETEEERRNRIIATNIGLGRSPTFGDAPKTGGGIFQIRRMGDGFAEFGFYGWNKNIRRKTAQVIEVRLGNNSNIRIAVVRRMIEIIRENETGDFGWESKRLNRDIMLSARPEDNAGLEEFMMREFYFDRR
jgi:hypothetical protein